MKNIFSAILLIKLSTLNGKDFLIKTGIKGYLVRGAKNSKNVDKSGLDYDEPAWLNRCSRRKEGAMVQKDVVGCGGGIEMKCPGGCLRIHKTLYA